MATLNSCLCDIHEGDVGTQFDVELKDCGVEVLVQGSDSADFLFLKPDGTTLRKAATVVTPPSSTLRYITETDDLDQAGRWELQLALNITSQSWEGHSCRVQFDVKENIEDV